MNPNPTTSVEKIAKQVESEWQMGGLSDGLYMDFTREVSRRLITSLLEGLVEEAEAMDIPLFPIEDADNARLVALQEGAFLAYQIAKKDIAALIKSKYGKGVE